MRTGMRIFNREELLSREFDEFNLPALWRTFRRLFACLPAAVQSPQEGPTERLTLKRLYMKDVPQLMRLQRVPILIVALVLVAALAGGWVLALRYPLPAGVIDFQGFESTDFTTDVPVTSFLPGLDVGSIFVHNLRVLGLGIAATPLSFGAVPLLLLLSPMLLVGFFAGEAFVLGLNPLLFLVAFILPHGIFELPAVVLATAFSVRLGASIMSPPPGFTISESLLLSLSDLIKVFVLLVIPLLLLAAVLEVHVTPLVVVHFFGA
jgi:uncharacterized membrane protein SpoIIM required for sporulation